MTAESITPRLNQIEARETSIPGLIEFNLPVHGDARGWFKANWQRDKFIEAGVPRGFKPVQNNISYNRYVGVTRGIHAEPWNKYISVAYGKVFDAIVDLRDKNFGRLETFELTPESAIFVPKGCGNSFQTLRANSIYAYLVDDIWRPGLTYPAIALDDPDLRIRWPIKLEKATVSDKDKANLTIKKLTL